MKILYATSAMLIAGLLLACRQGDGTTGGTDKAIGRSGGTKPTSAIEQSLESSPGKPTAPITIAYDIIGSAVVGQPVSVNLEVSSSELDQPVTLHYRVNDASAIVFAESQPQRVTLDVARDAGPRLEQVTVIPQREGRLYLNVSAEIETVNGTMFRSLAVPLQVGARTGAPAVNGEPQVSADGEAVISMPASESGEN